MRCRSILLLVALLASLLMRTGESRADEPQPAVTPVSASAETDAVAYSPNWPEPPNTGAMLLRLCLGTVVVLALCVGSLWLGKPWLLKLQGVAANNSAMQVEGSVALGNRVVLYLVKVGDMQMVAGTDATGLKSLIALPPTFKEVLDEQMPVEDPAAVVLPTNFETRLRTATGT